MSNQRKVTVYLRSEFMGNVVGYEGLLVFHGLRPYAQHAAVPTMEMIPRGKRKPIVLRDSSVQPWMLIADGWDLPPMEPAFDDLPGGSDNLQCSRSRHLSHSPRWTCDADLHFAPLIAAGTIKVVVDYRVAAGDEEARRE